MTNDYKDILSQYKQAKRIWTYNKESRLLLRKKKEIVAADTETTGLLFHTPSVLHDDDDRIVDNPFPFGLTLAFPHRGQLVLVWGRYGTDLYKVCQDVFASDCMKVWHNSKYDLRVCKTNGIEVNGTQLCTLTMSRIYWDRRKSHSLQALSEFICPGISDWEEDLKKELAKLRRQWSKRKDEWNPDWTGDPKEYVNYSFLPNEMIGTYSQTDVFMVWQLLQKLTPYMADEYSNIFDREMATTHVITKIEENGMGFDVKRGRAELKKLLPKIKLKRRILDELSPPDFTLGPQKILETLKFLGVKSKQLKAKGKETTNVDVLNQAVRDGVPKRAERFIKVLLDFRAYSKIANTYLKPLTEQAERTGGTVYTTINPTDSRTSRPASRDPNLLNIPNQDVKQRGRQNHVRECFVPRDGKAVYYFDVAQQEYAMLFCYAEANDLLQAYLDGADLHQHMADLLRRPDKRKIVKNQNFGVAYGLGIKVMAASQNISIEQAKEEMKIYHNEFPFIGELQRRLKDELRLYGYVTDYFGRKYHVPYGQAYKAVNAIVQGGSAQAFKQGLLQVDLLYEKKYPDVKIILPVYDEIILERKIKEDEKQFCLDTIKCMSEIRELMDVGLKFRIDVLRSTTNWAEKKKLEI
jgi:DNA polymerase I-like protein with 3'-5' exonuclease and polymerase domains